MSSDDNYNYGKDLKYKFNSDGSVDLDISSSGDIDIVGGDSDDSVSVRRENASQQLILRIVTPFDNLRDPDGINRDFGSQLYTAVGMKNIEENKLFIKALVLSAISDYDDLESILGINVDMPLYGIVQIELKVKLKNDPNILSLETRLGG